MTIDSSSAANKVAKTANGLADKAESKISKLADRAEKAAHRAETVLHDGIETLRTQTRVYADNASDKWDTTQKAVTDHVREKPLQGIAIAAGVGLIIGLLMGSRRN
jgi:ElaB/YqjD/DUF883 family membrane-anchored ribosome-binding protein